MMISADSYRHFTLLYFIHRTFLFIRDVKERNRKEGNQENLNSIFSLFGNKTQNLRKREINEAIAQDLI